MRVRAWILATGVGLASCGPAPPEPRPRGSQPIEPRVAATVEVGHMVYAVSAGAGGVWTANYENGSVSLVDPDRNRVVQTVKVARALGSAAADVHATEDALWLATDNGLGHLDPIDLGASPAARARPVDMAVTDRHLWLSRLGGARPREPIEAFGVEIRSANAAVPLPGRYDLYGDIAAGDAGVWALSESEGTLAAIAPAEGEPKIAVSGEPLFRGGQAELAVAHGYVWVETSDGIRSRLARYDPVTERIESLTLDGGGGVLAAGPDALWLLGHGVDDRGLLWSVDPDTMALDGPLVLEGEFRTSDITYGFGSVWITHDTNLLSRVAVTVEGTRGASVPFPEERGSGEVCDQLSAWVWCPEARWLRRVVTDGGLEVTGDTGTALRARIGSLDAYTWNTDAAVPVETIAEEQGYELREGTDAYSDGDSLLWEAQGLHIYLALAHEGSVDDLSDENVRSLIEASRHVPMEPDLTGARPLPKPEGDQRLEFLGDGRLRVWPNSEDVENQGRYLFNPPHCGLVWMIDFDGTFWEAIEPEDYGDGENYPFFYNSDRGVITFSGNDSAVYQASTGEEIQMKRLSGPIVTFPCD